jgi:hypothetical protein
MIDDILSLVRTPGCGRLRELMDRVAASDLTSLEVLALVAVMEAGDQRVNGPIAPVLQLV